MQRIVWMTSSDEHDFFGRLRESFGALSFLDNREGSDAVVVDQAGDCRSDSFSLYNLQKDAMIALLSKRKNDPEIAWPPDVAALYFQRSRKHENVLLSGSLSYHPTMENESARSAFKILKKQCKRVNNVNGYTLVVENEKTPMMLCGLDVIKKLDLGEFDVLKSASTELYFLPDGFETRS